MTTNCNIISGCILCVVSSALVADTLDDVVSALDSCSTSAPVYDVKAFRQKNTEAIMLSTFFSENTFDVARIKINNLKEVRIEGGSLHFFCAHNSGCIEFASGDIQPDGMRFYRNVKVSKYDFVGCDDAELLLEVQKMLEEY